MSVTTLKDSRPNVEKFVDRNLHNGVDCMVIFLDGDQPDNFRYLSHHAHVAVVVTDDAWWGGNRPPRLNTRQSANANLTKAVLTHFPWASWIMHIDSDEVAYIDRDRLDNLPNSIDVVRLSTLEAVSTPEGNATSLFKRKLDMNDLVLLHTLGVIEEPTNGAYFHGHLGGKSATRPSLERWLAIHHVVDAQQNRLEEFSADWLRLLHFESPSRIEFMRKWQAIFDSGPTVKVRMTREAKVVALRALAELRLPPEVARPYLMRIYERTTRDDVEVLSDLKMLESVDADHRRYEPRAIGAAEMHRLRSCLLSVAALDDKQIFRVDGVPEIVRERLAGLQV